MATFVLVHGAWSGAHTFHRVRPLLEDQGHRVFTPSLTGIGERVHLASSGVNLSTHISDVVNHVLYEDHRDFVLLGFSYGGAVVTGALRHIGDRVRHVVYLDAFVPADGQSVDDLRGKNEPQSIALGDKWQIEPRPRNFDDPEEATLQNARRVAQPAATFSEKVRLDRPLEEWPFRRTYVKATEDPQDSDGTGPFWIAANHARSSAHWESYDVNTSHMIPNNRPVELVEILLAMA